MDVFGIYSLSIGLNNQKIAIAGLIEIANERKGLALLPEYVVDFSPSKNLSTEYQCLPMFSVFDEETFFECDAMRIFTKVQNNRTLGLGKCFKFGSQKIFSENSLRAMSVLQSFVPSKELMSVSMSIAEWLGFDSVALQLRIERDWQTYLLKKFGTLNRLNDREEITVDPRRIFKKCSNTAGIPKKIWVCCDEDDLIIPVNELKFIALEFDYELLFKSDLPKSILIPTSRLKRSLIDFQVASMLPYYVGLTRSSFSQTLWFLKHSDSLPGSKHYIFNNPGESLLLRS